MMKVQMCIRDSHIGIGTGLCFSYILFNRFFEEFAKSGTLPPGLAVWLPNIIYLFIAVDVYKRQG